MSTYHIRLNELRPDLAAHLEKSIESVPGVRSATIAIDERRIVVEHEAADRNELAAAIREEGFDPTFD
jgi:copper chaperone CopZ